MSMNTKVLFISHDAQPHGAQMLLLHLVRWLVKNTGIVPHVLLKRPGPLAKDFEAVAHTFVLKEGDFDGLLRQCRRERYDLIYSNTITNGEVLQALATYDCPVITHVHELGYWISYRSGAVNNAQVVQNTDYFIACSQAVADCLHQMLSVPRSRIFLVHEFIFTRTEGFDVVVARQETRTELGLPPNCWVVGGSGTTDWRKSPDLFVQLANEVKPRPGGPEVHFVWVGGDHAGPEFGMLWHDVQRLGIEKRVHFLGHRDNPREIFAAFDVFALTSREDPYPLVNLEVAALGIPVVGFEQSGGVREWVEEDAGFVVPYLDVREMGRRVSELFDQPELRARLGARAQQKVCERHDVAIAGARIANIIEWTKLNRRLACAGLKPQEAA